MSPSEIPVPVDDVEAIRALVEAQAEAWNRGDATAFAAPFAEHGVFTNIRGDTFHGREAYERRHDDVFRGFFRASRIGMRVDHVRLPRPDIALVTISTEVDSPNGLPPGVVAHADGLLRTRLLDVLVRDGDAWRIAASHNVDIKPPARPPHSQE
jgi:uncharacterized protein (TIGR02246 family)